MSSPPPLQLCLLLPNAAAATDARWRCCLSTNQFTIVSFFFQCFSFLFFRHKHKKCCNFEKQVPTRALRCRLSLSRCAALRCSCCCCCLAFDYEMRLPRCNARARPTLPTSTSTPATRECRLQQLYSMSSHLHMRMSV